MTYLPIALIAAIAIVLVAVYRTRKERNNRIIAAKMRADETLARNIATRPAPLVESPSVKVEIHDKLSDEQVRILSKIFEDDDMYRHNPNHQWEPTEPSPLTKE